MNGRKWEPLPLLTSLNRPSGIFSIMNGTPPHAESLPGLLKNLLTFSIFGWIGGIGLNDSPSFPPYLPPHLLIGSSTWP